MMTDVLTLISIINNFKKYIIILIHLGERGSRSKRSRDADSRSRSDGSKHDDGGNF